MKQKIWAWVFLLLAALGVPAAVVTLFQEQVLEQPWLTAGCWPPTACWS
jgi:hypothetical protein